MKKLYQLSDELNGESREAFEKVTALQQNIFKKESELEELKEKRDNVAKTMIHYLQKKNYFGVRGDKFQMYLYHKSAGTPSFWQVFEKTANRLCPKDKVVLENTYKNLYESREKPIGLMVRRTTNRRAE